MIGLAQRPGELQFLKIIGADRQDLERGHGVAQFDGGVDQALLGDIDRHVGDRIFELLEQHARLNSRAGAEADQLDVRADRFRHLAAVAPQQLRLRPRDVILGQLADFLKEIGAALIVEKFTGERARRTGKPGQNFREKIRVNRLQIEHGHPAGRAAHVRSRASRMPVNCQRFSGWKKFR